MHHTTLQYWLRLQEKRIPIEMFQSMALPPRVIIPDISWIEGADPFKGLLSCISLPSTTDTSAPRVDLSNLGMLG